MLDSYQKMTKTITMQKLISYFSKVGHYSPWILTAVLYAPVFFDLYHSRWKSSDYTHAYFILPVFLWLVWRKRTLLRERLQTINPHPPFSSSMRETERENIPRLRGRRGWLSPTGGGAGGGYSPPLTEGVRVCPVSDTAGGGELLHPTSNYVGLFILLFGVSIYVFGWRGDSLFIATLSLLPVLYGLTTYLYGSKFTKVLFFLILYLIFLAPPSIGIIDSITLPLRYGVSTATEAVLKFFQYPITREGLLLSIGNNELFVGQPCSGFRSMITMFSAGLVYVFLSKANFSKKVILASAIIPLTLLGNLIRIIILCLITFYFGETAGQGFFHNFSGILIIVLITIGLLGLEYFLGKYMPNTSRSMPQALTVRQGNSSYRYTNKNLCITHALLLFAIIFCFGFPKTKEKYEGQNILSQLEIPHNIGGWQGKDVGQEWNIEDEKYFYISQVLEREYINGNKKLFFIILDAKNSHNPKICTENAGFKSTELNATEIHTSNGKFKAHCLYTEKNGEGYLLISWICVNKQIVDWVGQRLKLLWFSLFDQKGSNLLIRLDIPCREENIEDALNLAKSFISDFAQNISAETSDYVFGKNNAEPYSQRITWK